MTTTTTHAPSTGTWSWKDLLFPLISGAVGLLLVIQQAANFLVPWMPHAAIHDPKVAAPAMHLWHYAQGGMHGLLLLALPLLLLVWRPRQQVVLMQYLLVSGALLAAIIAPVHRMDVVPVIIVLAVLTVLYPGIRGLAARLTLRHLSRPLMALTLVVSPFLLRESARLVWWQIHGVGGDHATAGHWIAAATIPLTLIVAGLLAATRGPGWRVVGTIAGLSFLYLGAAAIALPRYDGSWGTGGGAASLLVGAAYLLVTYREARLPAVERRSVPRVLALNNATLVALFVVSCAIVSAQATRAGAIAREASTHSEEPTGGMTITTPGFNFDPKEIRVKAGTNTTLRFDTTGRRPHSFDVDELDVHVPAAPGQQAAVVLKPTMPGLYTFYCGIPGHREAGMQGTLVVEP